MANTLQVVVFRDSPDERTCAVVRCRLTKEVSSGDALRGTLIRALTKWFRQTEEGAQALAASSHDFNVGDLSVHYQDETLLPYLKEQGINHLNIETYQGGATDWSYDTHLFDAAELEGHE
jgi:hypothetical protein